VIVAELRNLLSALPDDMVVTIHSKHVVMVERRSRNSGTGIGSEPCACPTCDHPHSRWVPKRYEWPERLELTAGREDTERGDRPAPPVYYRGRWTKAMREVIDRYSDDPDAPLDDGIAR
jgi:hypothetical protein